MHNMRDHNHAKEGTRNQREVHYNQRKVHYGSIYLTTRAYMQPRDNKQTSRQADNGLCMVRRQFHAEASITMHNYADTTLILITWLAVVLGFRGHRGRREAIHEGRYIELIGYIGYARRSPFWLVWATESSNMIIWLIGLVFRFLLEILVEEESYILHVRSYMTESSYNTKSRSNDYYAERAPKKTRSFIVG
jgi:hypothetical protein